MKTKYGKIFLICVLITILFGISACSLGVGQNQNENEKQNTSVTFSFSRYELSDYTNPFSTDKLNVMCIVSCSKKQIQTVPMEKDETSVDITFKNVPIGEELDIDVFVFESDKIYEYYNLGEQRLIYYGNTKTTLTGENDEPVTVTLNSTLSYAVSGCKVSGKKYTHTITKASYNPENTILNITYPRSAIGADEQIILSNVDLEITVLSAQSKKDGRGAVTKTITDDITFDLDLFNLDDAFEGFSEKDGKLTDDKYAKHYTAKVNLGYQLNEGDEVTVELKSATITGKGVTNFTNLTNLTNWGKNNVDLAKINYALAYNGFKPGSQTEWDYFELTAEDDRYKQQLVTSIDLSNFGR